jgi:S-adenosylmethionine-diacylgycerolhomoserine-N-methlytransferase
MDAVYRRQRHLYDFTRKYYLFGRDALIRDLKLAPGTRLVEIGCGTARNLIAIARRYPGVRLYGLDASAEMLKTAQQQLARAGLEKRVILVQGLAEELTPESFGETAFDHALFSYSLSMIPSWRGALFAAAKALSGQGLIHIVDFGDLKSMPGRCLMRHWLSLFHVTPRTELLEALEREVGKAGKGLNVLPGRYAFRLSLAKGKLGTIGCGETVTAQL